MSNFFPIICSVRPVISRARPMAPRSAVRSSAAVPPQHGPSCSRPTRQGRREGLQANDRGRLADNGGGFNAPRIDVAYHEPVLFGSSDGFGENLMRDAVESVVEILI